MQDLYDQEFAGDSKIRIYKILELIQEFETSYGISYHNIYKALIRSDLSIANSVADNSIKLISIHGSKGLEAPIIILPDANSKVTLGKERLYFADDNLLLHQAQKNLRKKLI